MRQAQLASKQAVADGVKIIEIDFPVSGLYSIAGDGEGQNEMNASLKYLRQFVNVFRDDAASTRVFFPDNQELAVAVSGQTMDPAAGRSEMAPVFEDGSKFGLGYLTKQNAAWALFGVNMDKWSPTSLVQETDRLFIIPYPSFNPKEELGATLELYNNCARDRNIPMIIFNGELDRIRSGGYYTPLLFPVVARIAKELVPEITTVYYLKNFKGTRPGVLFRCYPGPWVVLRRNPLNMEETRVIWTGDERPSLKQVQLEILPSDL